MASYVDTSVLVDVASKLETDVTALTSMSGTLSSAGGQVSNGWSDNNSAIFAKRFGEFSTATGDLIKEIGNYAKFIKDCAKAYEDLQSTALAKMGGA